MDKETTTEQPQDSAQYGPEDFSEFEKWRESGGELPKREAETPESPAKEAPAAPEGEKPEGEAKTTPESEPETKDQEPEKEEHEEEDEPDQPKRAKKSGFQRRIDKLTQEKHQLEARVAALEARSAEKPAGDTQPEPKPEAKPTSERPKVEDFEDYDKFIDALTDWKIEQREAARKQEEEQRQHAEVKRQAEERQRETFRQWEQKQTAARQKHADYDDVMEAANDIPVPAIIQQAMLDSPVGAELAYYLASHKEEAQRIVGLNPLSAVRELGKIEAALSTPTAPPPKPKASAAPPPVKPVGGSKTTPSLDDPDLPYEDWEKRREEQVLALRRR